MDPMNPTRIPKEVLQLTELVGTCKLQRAIVYSLFKKARERPKF